MKHKFKKLNKNQLIFLIVIIFFFNYNNINSQILRNSIDLNCPTFTSNNLNKKLTITASSNVEYFEKIFIVIKKNNILVEEFSLEQSKYLIGNPLNLEVNVNLSYLNLNLDDKILIIVNLRDKYGNELKAICSN